MQTVILVRKPKSSATACVGIIGHVNGLPAAVLDWPTPRCADGMVNKLRDPKNIKNGSRLEDAVSLRNSEVESRVAPNPEWVSWLMGWPIGWESIEPLSQEAYNEWVEKTLDGRWWESEPDIPRIASGVKGRVKRLKALGNGQVSLTAATAWRVLSE